MTNKKINLMHTVLNLGVAGLERVVADLSLKMNRDLFNVEVCCFSALGAFADQLESEGIRVHLLRRNPNHFDAFHPFRVAAFFRKQNVHILHAHSGTFFTGAMAALLSNVPTVFYTEHGRRIVDQLVRIIEDRISIRFTDKVVAVSPPLKDRLISQLKFPACKVSVITNGVNMDTFCLRPKSTEIMNELNIPGDCQVVGMVGRFEQVKDHMTMLKAFEMIHSNFPNSVLLLVGEGTLRSELDEYAASHGLRERVIFAGVRHDIPKILNLMDVFVLSSLSEGTSISLLEAMASGVVPVVTDVGGNPFIVNNQKTGMIVRPQNPEQMANAVCGLLSDDQNRKTLGINAIEKIKRDYSLDRTVEDYTNLYLEVLQKKRKSRKILSDFKPEIASCSPKSDPGDEKK